MSEPETFDTPASTDDSMEPTAKPHTAKKAAKKAAKRATKKAATDAAEPPLDDSTPSEAKPAPKKRATRPKKTATPDELDAPAPGQILEPETIKRSAHKETSFPLDVASERDARSDAPNSGETPSDATPVESSQRRIGRVPGGGPVAPSEPQPSETAAALSPEDGKSRQGLSKSQLRREKRKRKKAERFERDRTDKRRPHDNRNGTGRASSEPDLHDTRPIQLSGPKLECNGMLELAPKGFGFLRVPDKNFIQARDDVYVPPDMVRRFCLRQGQWIRGLYQDNGRGTQLVEISDVNGLNTAEAGVLPHFDELKAVNPTKRISFEDDPNRFTTRVLDIMAPVGRGQRGLIVSPPRSGKTTLLLHMAEAIREKYEETIHLMVLLVDERPEEVTEFRRALPGAEIYASSNDENARGHCRIAELAIERAKRLVEAGKDVFLLMDSITRLARAYNNTMNHRGRGTGSGGITIGALEIPRRLFAAARNTRGGGSLTILATALIQTNSRADEAIFQEFKGTGNMELVLDRKIAENYIYPAVDIHKSGTRREELLIPDHMLHKIHLIRRGLAGHRPVEAMERLLFFLKKFPNNPQMLLEIKG